MSYLLEVLKDITAFISAVASLLMALLGLLKLYESTKH